MQAQSRLGANGSAGFEPAADERDAVVRDLTLGHELTARLQEEALRALRGQGQSEATAAFILREVSRAFTVCLSIMGSGSEPAAAPPLTDDPAVPEGARRPRDDGAPRKRTVTPSPDSDGHEWRKYGQKKIMDTSFPRCYYKCKYSRERGCPAMKRVQKRSEGDPPMYLVIYVHEHTCQTPAPEPTADTEKNDLVLGVSGGLSQQKGARAAGAVLHDVDLLAGRAGSAEERELQAFVSSLAYVLHQGRQAPAFSAGGATATAPGEPGPPQGRAGGDDVGPSGTWDAGDDDAPAPDMIMDYDVGEDIWGLDMIMEYDVMDTMRFDAF